MKKVCYPIEKIVHSTGKCPTDKWYVLNRIGEKSSYGEVWKACCENNCQYVLKFISTERTNRDDDDNYKPFTKQDIINEINLQKKCADLGLCPAIYDSWLCGSGGVIIMPSLQITARRLIISNMNDIKVLLEILDNIYNLVDKLHKNKLYHGDMHLNNIMIKASFSGSLEKRLPGTKGPRTSGSRGSEFKDDKYYFIDLGSASESSIIDKDKERNDYISLYMDLHNLSDNNPDNENLKILETSILEKIK